MGWAKLALPFLDEYITQTNKNEELFKINKIYRKFLSSVKKEKNEEIYNSVNYPGEINNHDILHAK